MLLEIQSEFASAVLDSGRVVPPSVTSHSGVPSLKRFSVYRNNVVMSLTEVLEAYFPVVARLVGEEFFRATARQFIVVHPPRSPILSRYGADFPNFLEGFEPVADVPYLADVARLEWLQQRAYHAADEMPLSARDLALIPPHQVADLRFSFHPSVGMLVSAYPVFSIWRTNTFDEQVTAIGLEAPGQSVLVARKALEVRTLEIPQGSAAFVTSLLAGARFGESASDGANASPDFNLQWTMGALIDMGAFIDVVGHRPAAPGNIEQHGVLQ